jgi:BON domain
MTQGLFGAVTPWTGISPGPAWPAFGASFTGAESAPGPMSGYGLGSGFGQFGPSAAGYASAPPPIMSGNVGTPVVVPGGVPASALIATMSLRRGQPHGPVSDQDVEELLYDAVELVPGAGEVEVRCEGGRVSLTGAVPNKRIKHDVGELAWAIPGINDVHNTLTITTRRRARAVNRESEAQPSGPSRKQA